MKKFNKKSLSGFTFLLLLVLVIAGCSKDTSSGEKVSSFPEKTITMVVPTAAGGSSDAIARVMAKYAEEHIGGAMVVSNVPGGASTLGTGEVVNAKADGYTLGFPPVGAVSVQPHYGQINYTYSDLEPIAQVSEEAIVLVSPKGKFKNLEDLVKYGKDNPGAIKYGNSSVGGPVHLVLEKLFSDAGVKAEVIGYKGSAEVKAALLGDHIDIGVMHPAEVLPILESGDVDALAVSTSTGERDPSLPGVATFNELDYEINFTVWKGVFGPKNLPEDVKKTLVEGFDKILKDPEFVAEIEKLGQAVAYIGPDEFTKKIEEEYKYYGEVIEATGMKEIVTGQK
ncbi:tripartite tricarboxylate transporter substrate binding protein [Bacillus sp. JJ1521]|uniref:Bug family tripartite tricarboxylate transporter substrate binding protein n=1 Tax=Bacillus sp. JJ1521 TaxID=3122957 RepID=UPI002FFDEA97